MMVLNSTISPGCRFLAAFYWGTSIMVAVGLLVSMLPGAVVANCTDTSRIKYQATMQKYSYMDDLVYNRPLIKCTFRNLSEPNNLKPHSKFSSYFADVRIVESNITTFTFATVMNSKDVVHLEVSSCGVKTIEKSAFSWYQNLEVLNFTNNLLDEVALDVFKGLDRLETLDVSHNRILKLISDNEAHGSFLGKVSHVNFSHNKLKSINGNFTKHLSQLTWADFSYNSINHLDPNDFARCHIIRHLDLSHNSIEIVPDEYFTELKRLDFLSLSDNLLHRVRLSGLSKLRELNLSNNSLSKTPDLNGTGMLRILNLAYNKITSWQAQNVPLKRLNIDNNHFTCTALSEAVVQLEAAGVHLVPGNLDKEKLHGLSCVVSAQ